MPPSGRAGPGPAAPSAAAVVRRLRAAGAVLLGPPPVPALLLLPFPASLAFGAPRTPWCLPRPPGGRRGGRAA
ncbi:amidase family protein, partial [Mycobacterium tuberculosis]|uniref:amidase family protein n=1 Tax=Mycobacterium tuberculosis TaxID=1773 RepID=UPI0023501E79